MAKLLNLPIICEGVETEAHAAFVAEHGCQFVQGYQFYRPMGVEQFEAIISDEDTIDPGGIAAALA